MKYTTVIVEDEPVIAKDLKKMLEEMFDFTVPAIAGNGKTGLEAIRKFSPHVVFTDIKMPEMDGMEMVEAMLEEAGDNGNIPHIVFVTAFENFAAKAFEMEACDFLIKPFTDKRLKKTVDRLKNRIANSALPDISEFEKLRELLDKSDKKTEVIHRLNVGFGEKVYSIPTEKIICLEAGDKYITVYAEGFPEGLIRTPLKDMIRRLPSDSFLQVHRAYIVNTNYLKVVHKTAHAFDLEMEHINFIIPVSRLFRNHFKPA